MMEEILPGYNAMGNRNMCVNHDILCQYLIHIHNPNSGEIVFEILININLHYKMKIVTVDNF